MDRYESIINNLVYIKHLKTCEKLEEDRIFCKHGLSHSLDVARIAMLMNLADGYGIEKDIIYATALLHDIGRDEEYQKGVSHKEASATLAEQILKETGYLKEEIEIIKNAIASHGNRYAVDETGLSKLIYIADKRSRNCFDCKASKECNWPMDKRNDYPIW